MVYHEGEETENVKRYKEKCHLTGDVYVCNGCLIENLEGHKKLIPTSTASTIEEAEQERIKYEAEREAERARIAELSDDETDDINPSDEEADEIE